MVREENAVVALYNWRNWNVYLILNLSIKIHRRLKCHVHSWKIYINYIITPRQVATVTSDCCAICREGRDSLRGNNKNFNTFNNITWITMSQRSRVIQLYKTLQYLGREYPVNPEKFRITCKKVFKGNSKETNPEKIEEMIAKGDCYQSYCRNGVRKF